ncbi:TonB-dependent receptor domain-containing protein [Horticoccus sp. 23ND18S-11]|uniref:TonB-dependent receptor domain-containing protein n=1 Tax=Horticoccus sp. 23ND18S-11 TaxID=3391832 RepID=UPI0039C9863D
MLLAAALASGVFGYAAEPGSAPAVVRPAGAAALVAGRVMSAMDGVYLRNARVAVEGSSLETLTNESGEFLLSGVPAGPQRLRVSYTGKATASVTVTAGDASARVEIVLQEFGETARAAGDVVKLDAFRVNTGREMSAADMAINEKRIAPNIRDVIATDAFGTMARDNLGDFLQYLPGVEVEGDGTAPLTVGLRGMPAEYTNIEMDGAGLSVPQTGGSTRVTALRGLTMSNVDRIEITKGPTPDTGADSIGGRINMIPRSAFDRSRPEFRYRTFVLMNSEFLSLRKTPGGKEGGDGKAYKWFPDFEVTYLNPVSRSFGYSLNASRNDYFYTARLAQRTYSIANSTAAAPYLNSVNAQVGHSFSRRSSLGAKFDFRLSARDTVSVAYNFNRYWVDFGNHQMTYATGTMLAATPTGRNATTGDFGAGFTQGRAGQGSVTQLVTQNAYQTTQTHQGQVTYRHRGPQWDVESTVAKSKTRLTYRLDSYGQLGQARLGVTGLTVRFDDIPDDGVPERITVTNAAGAVVDTNQLANLGTYTTPVVAGRDIKNNFSNAKFDVTRKFQPEAFTWSLKSGGLFKQAAKDRAQPQTTRTYAGPAFTALPAGTLTDPDFNLEGPQGTFKTQQWLSTKKAYELYQSNPSYYTTSAAADYIAWVSSLEESSESIYAGYLMADATFLKNRLRISGGARYEKTEVVARGTLTNLQLQFRRDANGRLIDGNPTLAGVQTVPITTDPLEVAKLTRLPLANVVEPKYDDVYPSVNATVTLRENLLLRLGYAHTIGRPTLAQLIPTTNVTEVTSPAENATGSGLGTITTSNPALEPWTGRNRDLALEYYTASGGLFSVSVYRRDVKNFISSTSTIATREMLDELGLADDYEGYLISHPENVEGSVRQTGLELSGRQRLRPWLSVFANYTRNRTTGIRAGDFSNAQTRRFNAGVQFAYKALSMTANYNWTGLRRGANSGIAPNAFVYTRPRELVNLSAEYLVRRSTSVFLTLTNVLKEPLVNETYGTDTPAYARVTSNRRDGAQVQMGVKGGF